MRLTRLINITYLLTPDRHEQTVLPGHPAAWRFLRLAPCAPVAPVGPISPVNPDRPVKPVEPETSISNYMCLKNVAYIFLYSLKQLEPVFRIFGT